MSVDVSGTSWDQCRSMVQYSFTSTKTRRLVRTDSPGRPHRLSHSSWTMDSWMIRWRLYTYRSHQNDSCIKMGSDESHLNVWAGSDGQSQDSVHKPQPFASLIQGREHKRKWPNFYLLPDLCPLLFSCCHIVMLSCKIANIRRKPTSDTAPTVSESVGSPRPTQSQTP